MQQNHLNAFAVLLIMLVAIVVGPTSGRAADSLVSTTQPSAAQTIVDQRSNIRITYDGAAGENSFVLKQSGEANLAKQVGYGRGGSMTVVQSMRDNTAVQQQFGRNDTAIIVQSGGMGDVARQTQR